MQTRQFDLRLLFGLTFVAAILMALWRLDLFLFGPIIIVLALRISNLANACAWVAVAVGFYAAGIGFVIPGNRNAYGIFPALDGVWWFVNLFVDSSGLLVNYLHVVALFAFGIFFYHPSGLRFLAKLELLFFTISLCQFAVMIGVNRYGSSVDEGYQLCATSMLALSFACTRRIEEVKQIDM